MDPGIKFFFDPKKKPSSFWLPASPEISAHIISNADFCDGYILDKTKTPGNFKERVIVIAKNYIGVMKKLEDKIIKKYVQVDLVVVKNVPKTEGSPYHTLFLNNNGQVLRIHTGLESKVQALYNQLRPHCILTDFRNYYKVEKVVGKGATAKVYLCSQLENKKEFAVKAFSKEELAKEKDAQPGMINEIKIMRRLTGHQNIIQLFEIYETANNVYLVMELLKGGNLQSKIQKKKKLPLEEVLMIMKQLSEGIEYMHQNNLMHRDLKLANILLIAEENNAAVKLVDFGLATDVDDLPYLYHRCGTPGYVAPEVLKSKEGSSYDKICDVFSLGVIFFILITGRSVFKGDSFNTVLRNNRSANIDYQYIKDHVKNSEVHDLIKRMIDPNPSTRITSKELVKHPLFAEVDNKLAVHNGNPLDNSPFHSPMSRLGPEIFNLKRNPFEKTELSFISGRSAIIDGSTSPIADHQFKSPMLSPNTSAVRFDFAKGKMENPSPFMRERMLRAGNEENKEGFESQLSTLQSIAKGKPRVAAPTKGADNEMMKKAILQAYYKKNGEKPRTPGGSISQAEQAAFTTGGDEGFKVNEVDFCDVADDIGEEDSPAAKMNRHVEKVPSRLPPSMAGRKRLTDELSVSVDLKMAEEEKKEVVGQKHPRAMSEMSFGGNKTHGLKGAQKPLLSGLQQEVLPHFGGGGVVVHSRPGEKVNIAVNEKKADSNVVIKKHSQS